MNIISRWHILGIFAGLNVSVHSSDFDNGTPLKKTDSLASDVPYKSLTVYTSQLSLPQQTSTSIFHKKQLIKSTYFSSCALMLNLQTSQSLRLISSFDTLEVFVVIATEHILISLRSIWWICTTGQESPNSRISESCVAHYLWCIIIRFTLSLIRRLIRSFQHEHSCKSLLQPHTRTKIVSRFRVCLLGNKWDIYMDTQRAIHWWFHDKLFVFPVTAQENDFFVECRCLWLCLEQRAGIKYSYCSVVQDFICAEVCILAHK